VGIGVGGRAAADKDIPNDTKDETGSLTREITEDERTVAAAASTVDEKRDRLQHLQRMLVPSTKAVEFAVLFAELLDEGTYAQVLCELRGMIDSGHLLSLNPHCSPLRALVST
jgi:hypothetical protein